MITVERPIQRNELQGEKIGIKRRHISPSIGMICGCALLGSALVHRRPRVDYLFDKFLDAAPCFHLYVMG